MPSCWRGPCCRRPVRAARRPRRWPTTPSGGTPCRCRCCGSSSGWPRTPGTCPPCASCSWSCPRRWPTRSSCWRACPPPRERSRVRRRGGPMSAREVSVQLLGGFGVTVDGRAVPADRWRRRSAASLVKLLALSPGRRLHRERVLATLWPDLNPAEAAPRLHTAAHYARRWLGTPGALVLAGDTVALCPDDAVAIDAVDFEQRARAALAARDPALAGAAAAGCPGELLADDPYEPWAEEPRERLRLLHLDVLRLAGRWAEVADREPADEQAHAELARRLAVDGDRAAALRQFERLERALR